MPDAWSLSEVDRMKKSGVLRQVDERFIPSWMKAEMTVERKLEFAYKKSLLDELVEHAGDELITDKSIRSRLVNEAARGGTYSGQIMTWLTRRWYYAEHENALASRHVDKGGMGVPKTVTDVKKGRPNSNVQLNPATAYHGVNFNLKRKSMFLKILWEQFCHNNLDMREAVDIFFLRAVGFFKKDGKVQSARIDPLKLPERSYLMRWGHDALKSIKAQMEKLGDKEWEQKKRARRGNAQDITDNVFDIYDIDGMYFNGFIRYGERKVDVGKPVVMLAVDRRSRAVVGFYVYLGRENGTAYRKCLFSAFTRKEEILLKYGMRHLEGFVFGPAQAVFLDRGPGIGDGQKKAIAERLRMPILMAEPGRGNAKGVVENVNGRFERRLADLLGFYKRGGSQRDEWKQKIASSTSRIEFRQFMQLLLAAISEYNLGTDVSHLIDSKKFDANFKPNPHWLFLRNKLRKRADAAYDWPPELIYTHLLDRFHRTATRGIVTVMRAHYTSAALKQYADEWEASRAPFQPSAPVEVYRFAETPEFLLWKDPDGNLRLLEATKQTAENYGGATDWAHSFINQVKAAESHKQRVADARRSTLATQKEKVLADADGLPAPTNAAGRRANRKEANRDLQTQEFAEGARLIGIPASAVAAAKEKISEEASRGASDDSMPTVASVDPTQVIDTNFD